MFICLYNFFFFPRQQGRRVQPAHQVYIWGGEILRQKLCSKSRGQQRGTETKPVGRGTWKHPCHYQFICTCRSVICLYNKNLRFFLLNYESSRVAEYTCIKWVGHWTIMFSLGLKWMIHVYVHMYVFLMLVRRLDPNF